MVLDRESIAGLSKPIAKQAGIYCLLREGVIVFIGRSADMMTAIRAAKRNVRFTRYACIEGAHDAETLRQYVRTYRPAANRSWQAEPEAQLMDSNAAHAEYMRKMNKY